MNSPSETKKFGPTLILSIFTAGIGAFLYLGRPKSALALCLFPTVLMFAFGGGLISFPSYYSYLVLCWAALVLAICLPLFFRKNSSATSWYAKWYWCIALSFVMAFATSNGLRSLSYQPFSIQSGSMLPNLVSGDIIYANKFVYGYSLYSSLFGFLKFEGRTAGSLPERGDVIVFKLQDGKVDYVQRVIGMPGEYIQLVNGIPRINGVPLKHAAQGPYVDEAEGVRAALIEETLPEGRVYSIIDTQADSPGDDTSVLEIPAGHYFLLGDHRDNSMDSRFTGEFVSLENIVGRVDRIVSNQNGTSISDRQVVNKP